MAKCPICGEYNPDNGAFCTKCGKPLVNGKDLTAIAYENAQKEFNRDAQISVNREKITFVCELCGTINRIDSPNCVKCGKPRPRSEFVNALKRIKDGTAAREEEAAIRAKAEAAAKEAERQAEEALRAKEAELQSPMAEESEKKEELALLKYEPDPNQTNPVRQPIVIVPYVDSHQQLLQYKPNQVYRFEPYSYEEISLRKDKEAELVQGAAATPEELIRLRAKKQQELKEIESFLTEKTKEADSGINYNIYAKRVRITNIFVILFSALLIIAAAALPILKNAASFKGLEIVKSLGNCINTVFDTDIGFVSSGFVYGGWTSWVTALAYIGAAVIGAVIFIRAIVRLIRGRERTRGFVLPLIALLLVIATGASLLLGGEEFGGIDFGLYVAAAAALILTVIGFFSVKNNKVV